MFPNDARLIQEAGGRLTRLYQPPDAPGSPAPKYVHHLFMFLSIKKKQNYIEGICIENPMKTQTGGVPPSIIAISATTGPFLNFLENKSIAT